MRSDDRERTKKAAHLLDVQVIEYEKRKEHDIRELRLLYDSQTQVYLKLEDTEKFTEVGLKYLNLKSVREYVYDNTTHVYLRVIQNLHANLDLARAHQVCDQFLEYSLRGERVSKLHYTALLTK